MDNGNQLPKMNIKNEDRELTSIEKEYIKRAQQVNEDRVKKWAKIRYRNRISGTVLGISVLSIYFYSMFAIKQENFLDDFVEPEKITE